MEGVPLPEAAAVAADEAHLARRELEARPPHQRAVAEDPHRRRQLRALRLPRGRGGGGEGRAWRRLRALLGELRVALHLGAAAVAVSRLGRRGALKAARAARPAPPARVMQRGREVSRRRAWGKAGRGLRQAGCPARGPPVRQRRVPHSRPGMPGDRPLPERRGRRSRARHAQREKLGCNERAGPPQQPAPRSRLWLYPRA